MQLAFVSAITVNKVNYQVGGTLELMTATVTEN